ncbi:major facilitator superfamily domain-containing protein [Lentinula raphanica]|nr:major facilitator superfamily domain-containing protein [Lentinula raphanica]
MQYAPGVFVGHAFDAGYLYVFSAIHGPFCISDICINTELSIRSSRHMIAIGSFLEVFSIFMLSLVHEGQYYQVFLAQAIGIGLGQALLFIPSITVISQHFKRRRSFAIGVAVTGASVGGIIWPILLNQLDQKATFGNANRAAGAVAGVLLLCANLLMKPRPVESKSLAGVQLGIKSVFRDVAYMLYAVNQGVAPRLAFYTLAILNAGSIVGRLVPNFFADRVGPYNMIIPCLFLTAMLLFVVLGVHSFTGIVLFGLFYGCTSGSYISLIPSIIGQLSRQSGQPGLRMGFAFTSVGFWILIGTPIEGALLHLPGSDGGFMWSPCIFFSAIAVACGAVGMLISRMIFVREGRNEGLGQLI